MNDRTKSNKVPMISLWYDYNELSNQIILRKSFTYSAVKGFIMEGFIVAPYDTKVYVAPQDMLGAKEIKEHLRAFASTYGHLLSAPSNSFNAFIATDGYLNLNVVVVLPTKAEALLLAKKNKVNEIYDILSRQIIKVGGNKDEKQL